MEQIVKGWIIAISITALLAALAIGFVPNATESSGLASDAPTRNILLVANEHPIRVAPENDLYPQGLLYEAMTFNGTVPGPLIFAEKGEVLNVTLRNEGDIVHSLNFHAAFGPSQALSGSVEQGSSKSWTMRLDFPGAFLYHCDGDNLNGMWEHVASGMYGGIVVREESDPVGNEFYVAFSELYGTKSHPPFLGNASMPASTSASTFDIEKFLARQPDLVLTNGMAFKHIPFAGTQSKMVLNSDAEVFQVRAGESTTWHLFNAGPRNPIAFNFGGGLVQISSVGGEPVYDEVLSIPPGSGTTLQVTFPEPGAYFGNDHDAASLLYGSGFVVIAE